MSNKELIVGELGENALLLPRKLQLALEANDRLKVCMSILQAGERHADHPQEKPPDLSAEQHAVGMAAEPINLSECRREADGRLLIPGVSRLRQIMMSDLDAMLEPLELAGYSGTESLSRRKRLIEGDLPEFSGDIVPPATIGRLTAATRDSHSTDTLHILVMDLHKAVNALQASLAQDTVDGARVWQVDSADRALIQAFMAGVNETAPLKFDHPGLDTTATRAQGRLIIQNDIGTTDAHVLVLHVENLTARLMYTDVHARRLRFFQDLFKPHAVTWTEPCARRNERLSGGADYVMSIGTFEAADQSQLERYLRFLGANIVFLIDWNRARKRLREFLPKDDVNRLLKWAADKKLGHRGFLQLGGERLLYEAIEFAQPTQLRYGEHLHEALGREAAFDYLQFVFREATAGLLAGRSERFIRDEIKADLARRFRSAHANLMNVASSHAELVFDLATAVHDALIHYPGPEAAQLLARTARRAQQWEQQGDSVVTRIRSLARRTATPQTYMQLLHEADEAADGLEEAAFLLTHLVALSPADELIEPLRLLAALLVEGAQESIKMLAAASHVTRDGAREDLQDFFAAVDRIVAIEHSTDSSERSVTSALLTSSADVRTFNLVANAARLLEKAADGLSLSALKLRDHLLNEVMTG